MSGDSPSASAQPAAPAVEGFVLGPVETNCYIVHAGTARPGAPCWIVDAGFDPAELLDRVRSLRLKPEALILTHAHGDHMAGVEEVRAAFPGIPVLLHEDERGWLEDPELNLSDGLGMPVSAGPPDRLLRDGDELTLDGVRWRVLHTPGHSPGGITLHQPESAIAIVGDALVAGSVGRMDLPGGDEETLVRSIRSRLYMLPDATFVYPGHGPTTTIGRERRTNPFVRG